MNNKVQAQLVLVEVRNLKNKIYNLNSPLSQKNNTYGWIRSVLLLNSCLSLFVSGGIFCSVISPTHGLDMVDGGLSLVI